METTQAQVWKGTAFSIEREEGKAPGTVIFRLSGPLTARDRYGSLTPQALSNMLEFQSTPDERLPVLNIFDLTDVPYMDSTGLGMVMTHHTRCAAKGIRLVVAGASQRVQQLFEMTKVDTVLNIAGTVAEADVA